MKYSPLAIHCASLCFDVIQDGSFKMMKHADIDGFRDEVYVLIRERSLLAPKKYAREHQFISYITDGVLAVLHQCLNNPTARDSEWILSAIESRIDISIKTILH
ncbi:hypothetical protein [Vibrio brasiliensis]